MSSNFECVGHRIHIPLRTDVRSVVFTSSACSKIELMFFCPFRKGDCYAETKSHSEFYFCAMGSLGTGWASHFP
ncbi:MAG: hypothetical protein A2007_04520 [Verrucomicrobia bacterium GWC2_42_7]|nr:MAG: hypothetical protein A2007_04520 [Verrucomicrobia bacterium GWC2_42_7]